MPERSCISCRRKGVKGELLRIAEGPDGAVLDYNEKLPGRGAYVCPSRECITKGITAQSLSRAFRSKTAAPGVDEFMGLVAEAAGRRIRSLLGMARKSGRYAYGHDSVLKKAKAEPGGLLIAAEDISSSSLEGVERELARSGSVTVRYSRMEELGVLMGTRPVGLIYITDAGLASSLIREFNRLSFNTGGE